MVGMCGTVGMCGNRRALEARRSPFITHHHRLESGSQHQRLFAGNVDGPRLAQFCAAMGDCYIISMCGEAALQCSRDL